MKVSIALAVSVFILMGCTAFNAGGIYDESYEGGAGYYRDSYRYDADLRRQRYQSYYSERDSAGSSYSSNIGHYETGRYRGYNSLGHSLHSSRYGSFTHGHRHHQYHHSRSYRY